MNLLDDSHLVQVPDKLTFQLMREVSSLRSLEKQTVMPTHDLSETTAFSDIVSQVRAKLLFGPGLALLSGKALSALADAQLEAMHFLVCAGLGRPMWQNCARDLIVRVEDTKPQDPDRARGFKSNTRMLMHTDGWDCAGLMCLSEPLSGGASLFARSQAVHDVIATEVPDLLGHFFDLWEWDIRFFTEDPDRMPVIAPIFSIFDEQLSCRYGSSMLRNGPRVLGRELSPSRTKALDIFEEVASRDSLVTRHLLRRGESVWMNNSRILHGREAFRDSPDGSSPRKLIRLWAKIDKAPRKAAEFTAFDIVTFGQSES
jgi:hypothetical protein